MVLRSRWTVSACLAVRHLGASPASTAAGRGERLWVPLANSGVTAAVSLEATLVALRTLSRASCSGQSSWPPLSPGGTRCVQPPGWGSGVPAGTAWAEPRVLTGHSETPCLSLLPVSGQTETPPDGPPFRVLPLNEAARGHSSSLPSRAPYLGCLVWSQ